jgi:protein-disulfide isomerase
MKNVLKFGLIIGAILVVILGIYAIAKNGTRNNDSKTATIDFSKNDILKIRESDNIKGDKNAPITIIDYSDYQCPYCIKYDNTLNQIVSTYPTKVKWVYRHFPLPFHKAAKQASIGAEAAGAQGKYWEFHDKLVANSKSDGKGLQDDDLIKYATELGLDIDKFKSGLKDQKYIGKVESDANNGTTLKIQGTPASYLIDKTGNIEVLEGALSFDQLKAKIDSALTK